MTNDKTTLIERILNAGCDLWEKNGSRAVTHRAIAAILGRNPSGVLYHFNYNMGELRDAVAVHAVETKRIGVILQLIVSTHPATAKINAADRAEYLATLQPTVPNV